MLKNNCNCINCGEQLTEDEFHQYQGELCYKCCARAWKMFELAHGGVCKFNTDRIAINKQLKDYIFKRDGKCLKCGENNDLTIDHVVPVSMGGDNHHSNLQVLCRKCNSIKGNYPEDYREVIE